MAFKKEVTIYENIKKGVRVYINQCHNKGKKTRLFTIRRDDNNGFAHYLGCIKWDGGWRQYIFFPEQDTKWSSSCGRGIFDFCDLITKEERLKWKR